LRKVLGIVFLVSLFTNIISAEETVINSRGETVLLKDDNTWKVITINNSDIAEKNFRKSAWGMSVEQVKATETSKPKFEDSKLLVYSDSVSGLSVDVAYIFVNNKLIRTKYVVSEKHSNKTDYIDDYKKLKTSLSNKYSKPVSDKQYWKNDLYKSDSSEWGMAVSIGHLSYFCSWENANSSILLYLTGDNYVINLGIEYSSKQLSKIEDTENQKATTEKL
jgi:hypothetical protein